MSDTETMLPGRRTRSPRARVEVDPQEFIDPETGAPIKRRSRRDTGNSEWDVPEKYRKPRWDYQWFTMKVLGVEEDPETLVSIADGGWRAVRPDEMPNMVPSGYSLKTIDRRGMRLFTRPLHISEEARAEDAEFAREVRRQKFAQAQMGDPANRDMAPRAAVAQRFASQYEPLPADARADIQEV
jgi:hypothetical protein